VTRRRRRRKRTLIGTWFALFIAFNLLCPFHDAFSTAHMVWAWSWSIGLTILEHLALRYNALRAASQEQSHTELDYQPH
jgi:uncharacterized RDD family membrane protein YckC